MPIKETKKYEIGYLISSFITAEQVGSFVADNLETVIKKESGEIISRLKAEMKTLAYPINRVQNNKKTVFKEGYFGSLMFELEPANIASVGEIFKKNESILRFLITLAITDQGSKKPIRKNLEPKTFSPKPNNFSFPKRKVDKEGIDREIEDLLAAV